MRAIAVAVAGILALAPAVRAGSAVIHNKCDFDVYLWPISVDESPAEPHVISASSGSWSQEYKTCSSGGMSLKLSKDDSLSEGITQFEYTLDPKTIWYDISNVDCFPFGAGDCPFKEFGMYIESGPGCPTASCIPKNETCGAAYTFPKDDWASLSCQPSEDTVLYLCSPSANGASSSGDSAGDVVGSIVSSVAGDAAGFIGAVLPATTSEAPSPTEAAPSTTETPTTSAAPTTTTPSPSPKPKPESHYTPPAPASSSEAEVAVAAAPSSSEAESSAPAPAPSTSSWSAPSEVSLPVEVPSTTLATVTTPAPELPPAIAIATEYVTVTTLVSTAVVWAHDDFHKNKRERRGAHPHARRHHHEE